MTEQPPSGGVWTWDVADRMRKGLREANVGISEMASYLGVGRNTVSTWINGKIQPSTQTLRLWALRTGTDYEWLAYGAVDNHVAAARAISDPGINNAGSTGRVVLLSNDRARFGPCAVQAAA